MKKKLYILTLLSFGTLYSQDTESTDENASGSDYNRWTVEVNAGQSKG